MATRIAPPPTGSDAGRALAAYEAELASQQMEGHWQEAVYLPEHPDVRIQPFLWNPVRVLLEQNIDQVETIAQVPALFRTAQQKGVPIAASHSPH